MTSRWRLIGLLPMCLVGCGQSSDPPSHPGLKAPDALARTLALQPPDGASVVDESIARIQAKLALGSGRLDDWVALGSQWIRKARLRSDPGFYLNASACAQMALAISSEDVGALNLKGLILLNEHRFSEARDLATRILARVPEDRMALGTLSDAELELGNIEGAVLACNRMMEQRPDLPSYSRVSYLEWLQGRVDVALQAIQSAYDSSATARDPEPAAWAAVQEGMIHWHEGAYGMAEASFVRAQQHLPDFPPALTGVARVEMARGAHDEAARLLERALAQSPTVEIAWLLGDARTKVGDVASAKDAYEKAVSYGRQSDKRSLALFWATRGEELHVALDLILAEQKVRGGVYTDDVLALVLLRLGRLPMAEAAMDRALALGTRDASLYYHAGLIRMASGRTDEGMDFLRKALDLNPAFSLTGAEEARKVLAESQSGNEG